MRRTTPSRPSLGAADVAAAGLRAPVATVIGDVVRLRDTLRWFDRPDAETDPETDPEDA